MRYLDDEFIWAQKYRPRTVKDCILPEKTKEIALGIVDKGFLPNLLLAHPSGGCGKSTLAMAICEDLGVDYISINASLDANIDSLRNNVRTHASTLSFSGNKKAIIWEEADAIPIATQNAMRAFMEEYSSNCSHILTANYKHKIIPQIQSRCDSLEFSITASERPKIARQILKRCIQILKVEGVEYVESAIVELIIQKFPDFRNVLNALQGYSGNGKIDVGVLITLEETVFKELIGHLKNKEFTQMRKWLIENNDIDSATLFDSLYKTSYDNLKPSAIPELVLILAKYQSYVSQVANQEINTAACLTELMMLDGWN